MKKVKISTSVLKAMNVALATDGLKICSETYLILPLKDKFWGKRTLQGVEAYEPYCKFAR